MANNWNESVNRLIRVFGGESESTLGASVFQSPSRITSAELESFAFLCYKHFVGKSWEAFGEENWSRPWALLQQRPHGSVPNILQEISSLSDPATALAASQLTENHDSPVEAAEALQAVFDSPEIQELRLYRAGDSEAITGLAIVALNQSNGAMVLVFLMD
jgi:hypothetical protein